VSDWKRARSRQLGGRGGEGSQCGALLRESGTGGRPKWLIDARTSAVVGQWQLMASGMLQ
jgi:hypothetical protein